jgi:hypothetical protein
VLSINGSEYRQRRRRHEREWLVVVRGKHKETRRGTDWTSDRNLNIRPRRKGEKQGKHPPNGEVGHGAPEQGSRGAATHMNFCFQAQSGKARANGVPKMLGTSAGTVSSPVPFLAVTALLAIPATWRPTLSFRAFFHNATSSRTGLGRLAATSKVVLSHGRRLCWPPHTRVHTTTPAQPSQLATCNRSASPRFAAERVEIASPDVILAGRQCPWAPCWLRLHCGNLEPSQSFKCSFPLQL